MPITTTTRNRHIFAALFLAGASLCTAASALDANALKAIEARYQAERAACESGRAAQDRETCLQEAVNARAAARRGELDDVPGTYEKNAVARCEVLPEEERDLCRRRARGEGEVKGSVEGGGILREYREVTLPSVKPQLQQVPAAPATPQAQTAPQNSAVKQNGK